MDHQFTDGACTICRQPVRMANWWRLSSLGCPGVRWIAVGELADFPHLATMTTLRARSLKPRDIHAPAACYFAAQAKAYRMLYDTREAVPLRPVSDRQAHVLTQARQRAREARTCSWCHLSVRRKTDLRQVQDGHRLCQDCKRHWEISSWAGAALADAGAWAILDTETTGLDASAEIVEVAVLGLDGEPLLDTLMRPGAGIPPDCFIAQHGITDAVVSDAPTFADVYQQLAAAIGDRRVLIYNQSFDVPMVTAECERLGLASPLHWDNSLCMMELYAEYVGDWSHERHAYRWQPLPFGGPHRAMTDCQAVLKLLHQIAGAVPPSPYPAPSPETLESAAAMAAAVIEEVPF